VSARPILVVGSLAYDDVRTPVASRDSVLGGAASYFSMAASLYAPVRLVGVVGDDFREDDVARLAKRGIDIGGLERRTGRSFRWRGTYDFALDTAETINTDLGVFGDWRPQIPPQFTDSEFVFLANIHPEIQLATLDQITRPTLVALDTMNYWIEKERDALIRVIKRANIVSVNEGEVRQLIGTTSILRAAREILALGPRALVVKRGEHGATLFTNDSMFWSPAWPSKRSSTRPAQGTRSPAECSGTSPRRARSTMRHCGERCCTAASARRSPSSASASTGSRLRHGTTSTDATTRCVS
jgi:sugar/nucleoside kinase (ribokinase family)